MDPAAASLAPNPAPNSATRPEFVPENFWDATKGEVKGNEFKTHLDTITARIAADDSRKLTLPQKPEDYKLELPQDFKLPAGAEWEWDDKDPLLTEARKTAQELGIDQAGFSKLLALHVGTELGQSHRVKEAHDAEIAKLGATGSVRIDTVRTWAKAMVGDDMAKALDGMLVTAKHVEAFEKLMQKFTSQGSANFSQQHREQSNSKFDEAEYEKSGPFGSTARTKYMQEHGPRQAN